MSTSEAKANHDFKVDLDLYKGPIDLLLHLVKKNEVGADSIPVAAIAKQYSEFLEVVETINIDLVGDFLEIAGLLVESKLRAILPRNELEENETERDPRQDLVQRLLLYKQFRDASELLSEQGRVWQERYSRVRNDLPPRKIDPADQPIHEVELWDLVSAFGRVLKRQQKPPSDNIIYDDTPITVYMERIHTRLIRDNRIAFSELFDVGMHKSAMVGIFLAILELVRHHGALTEQGEDHGEIMIVRGENFTEKLELGEGPSFLE